MSQSNFKFVIKKQKQYPRLASALNFIYVKCLNDVIMKAIKKSRFLSSVLAVFLLVFTLNTSVSVAQNQGEPIKFQYAGDVKGKYENGNYYIYTYCNRFEGDTCTNPEAATRIQIPEPTGWLRAIFFKIK